MWEHDWAWSLPLIIGTTVTHVVVLGFVTRRWATLLERWDPQRQSLALFSFFMGAIALLATVLLAGEAIVWGLTYRALGALTDGRLAILYSLNAITAFGHTDVHLEPHWQLMGALEALNGIILFGLTIGFLFMTIQSSFPRPDWLHTLPKVRRPRGRPSQHPGGDRS
jgi:hypothetical protein